MLAELGRKVDKYLLFDISDDELVKRLGGRTVCDTCQTPYKGLEPGTKCEKCGGALVRRKDDEPEAIRNRLEVYRKQTAPVIDWVKEQKMNLVKIDASGDVDEITEQDAEGARGVIQLKSQREIEIMARGGRILADTVKLMEHSVKPGMTTADLDKIADDFIRSHVGRDAVVQGTLQFPREHLQLDQQRDRSRYSVEEERPERRRRRLDRRRRSLRGIPHRFCDDRCCRSGE